MNIRIPIQIPLGRRLRVVIYARYSTDEQHPSSIADQIKYCRSFLANAGITAAEIATFDDAEISGELISRPGIDEVRLGVQKRLWDLLVVEDGSRLFRHETELPVFVETAVDANVRVICINDYVDTAEPDWQRRLADVARQHAETNRYTSMRIKRRLDSLWNMGAAIGQLRPGYRRRPTVLATSRTPEKGPYFDEIDPDEAAIIRRAYEMIAAGDEPWVVGAWLTKQGLRKCSAGRTPVYSKRNTNELIQRTIHRGHDVYRETVSEKRYRTGKRVSRHRPELMLPREMPHLRIVSDTLWFAANAKIDARRRENNIPSGDAHPQANIPRDSRFPLSQLFVCACCSAKMWAEGRNGGGYRCSQAKKGACWNKATALRKIAHHNISRAVVDELLQMDDALETLVTHIDRQLRDNAPRQADISCLEKSAEKLRRECARLISAIASGDAADASAMLVSAIKEKEVQLANVDAELEQLRKNLTAPPQVSRETIRQRIDELAAGLLDCDVSCGSHLARLIRGKIRAVPYRQFGSDKIVLRAEFDFRPVRILPDQLLAALSSKEFGGVIDLLPTKTLVVDLFDSSSAPKYALTAFELKASNPSITLEQLGERLGISKRTAHLALQLGKELNQAGLSDPFVRLIEAPLNASRWRTRKEAA